MKTIKEFNLSEKIHDKLGRIPFVCMDDIKEFIKKLKVETFKAVAEAMLKIDRKESFNIGDLFRRRIDKLAGDKLT